MPTSSNIFCAACRKFMRPKKNGVVVEEKRGNNLPYKLWLADEWECKKCGVRIVIGFAPWPFAEYFQEHYERAKQRAKDGTFYEEDL